MNAIKYLEKRSMMCNMNTCHVCPLGKIASQHMTSCKFFEELHPEQAIETVANYLLDSNEFKFRAMWSYLSEHPEADKNDAIRQLGDDPYKIKNACYACNEVNGNCSLCPLPERVCAGKDSLYSHWLHTSDSQVSSELAKIISASEWEVRGNND